MDVKTKAIVLRSVKYGDASLIVDMLTESMGRVSFIVRIPKTQKGKLKKHLFQPLTILSIVFNYRQRSSLQHIRDINIAVPYTSIPVVPAKIGIAMFLAEFLTYVTRDEQRNDPLYQYVESSLRWLDDAIGGYANFHLVFMLRLSRFIGFWPNLDDYHEGCLFDLREARFTSIAPLHHDVLQPAEARFIGTFMRMNYGNMRAFKMSRTQRNHITDIILLFYRLHVADMPELKCLDVLKELFV